MRTGRKGSGEGERERIKRKGRHCGVLGGEGNWGKELLVSILNGAEKRVVEAGLFQI